MHRRCQGCRDTFSGVALRTLEDFRFMFTLGQHRTCDPWFATPSSTAFSLPNPIRPHQAPSVHNYHPRQGRNRDHGKAYLFASREWGYWRTVALQDSRARVKPQERRARDISGCRTRIRKTHHHGEIPDPGRACNRSASERATTRATATPHSFFGAGCSSWFTQPLRARLDIGGQC